MYIEPATPSAIANMSPYAKRQTPFGGYGFEDLSAFPLDKLHISIKLALVFSSISLFCGLVTAYWFMRMRRRFRHDLIMALILSNMLRALWHLIFPAIEARGGYQVIPNETAICQVCGFFLSVGIEASDFSVLLIAIHSALYVFRPRIGKGEGGLYPYRYYAYGFLVTIPIILASAAFANSGPAYTAQGAICYLPTHPIWFLGLTWYPRYAVFVCILIIYLSIYFYVKYRFHRIREDIRKPRFEVLDEIFSQNREIWHRGGSTDHSAVNRFASRRLSFNSDSSFPGLKALTRSQTISQGETRACHKEISRNPPDHFHRHRAHSAPPSMPQHRRRRSSASEMGYTISRIMTPPPAWTFRSLDTQRRHYEQKCRNRSLSPHSRNSNRKSRRFNIFGDREDSSAPSAFDPSVCAHSRLNPGHGGQPCHYGPQEINKSHLIITRERIERHLRFLFIYPLVYLILWLPAFVNHVLKYDRDYTARPSYALSAMVTATSSSMCAVDCILFSLSEEPWKHIPRTDGSFWDSLRFWTIRANWRFWEWQLWHSSNSREKGTSRSPAEVRAQAEVDNRGSSDIEMVMLAAAPQERSREDSGIELSRRRSAQRNWWDVELDSLMKRDDENPFENFLMGFSDQDSECLKKADEAEKGKEGSGSQNQNSSESRDNG